MAWRGMAWHGRQVIAFKALHNNNMISVVPSCWDRRTSAGELFEQGELSTQTHTLVLPVPTITKEDPSTMRQQQ